MVIRSIHGHLGPHQHLDGGQHQREEEDRVHRHLLLPEAVDDVVRYVPRSTGPERLATVSGMMQS